MLAAKLLVVVLSVISFGECYEEHAKTKKYLVEDDKAKHFLVETEDESPQETEEVYHEEDPAPVGGVQNKYLLPTVLPHKMRWMSGNFFYI